MKKAKKLTQKSSFQCCSSRAGFPKCGSGTSCANLTTTRRLIHDSLALFHFLSVSSEVLAGKDEGEPRLHFAYASAQRRTCVVRDSGLRVAELIMLTELV